MTENTGTMDASGMAHSSAHEASSPVVGTLFGLTCVTGIIDAVSFLGLGHVFTANMTGNVVLLGFALGGSGDLSVRRSLTALIAFAGGGVLGGRLTNGHQRSQAGHLVRALSAEAVLVGLASGMALIGGANTSSSSVYLLIALTALAMGLRNAVVRKLGVPDLTTTVLTMTVTGLAADSGLAHGKSLRAGRRILVILAMCSGAIVGTTLLRGPGMWLPLMVSALAASALAAYLHLSEGPTERTTCKWI